MLMGQVAFMQESPWVSWLSGPNKTLRPYEHYVPLRMDLADMGDKLAWLRQHPEEAERIATAGRLWAAEFLSYDWVLYYLDQMLRGYAEYFSEPLDVEQASSFD